MKNVFLDSLFFVVLDIVIVVVLIKLLQRIVSIIAKTTNPRFHNIYQGGELLKAKNRRYSSNLYILIVVFQD